MESMNPSPSHAAPTWKSQRFPRKTLPASALGWLLQKEKNLGNSREPGSKFHGNSRGVWNVLEALVAQNVGNFGCRARREQREEGIPWNSVGLGRAKGFFPKSTGIPAQEFQENVDFHGISWFGWERSFNPIPIHGGTSQDAPTSTLGHFQGSLWELLTIPGRNFSQFPFIPSYHRQQNLKGDFRELCHLQLMGKSSGIWV